MLGHGHLGGRLLESDEVHLDPEVLHQQLPGHAAHRVEGVVRVGPGGAGQQEVAVRVPVHLLHLTLLLTLHQQPLQTLALASSSVCRLVAGDDIIS